MGELKECGNINNTCRYMFAVSIMVTLSIFSTFIINQQLILAIGEADEEEEDIRNVDNSLSDGNGLSSSSS
jgi:hypothetical protein